MILHRAASLLILRSPHLFSFVLLVLLFHFPLRGLILTGDVVIIGVIVIGYVYVLIVCVVGLGVIVVVIELLVLKMCLLPIIIPSFYGLELPRDLGELAVVVLVVHDGR